MLMTHPKFTCFVLNFLSEIIFLLRSEAGAAMVPVSWTEMQCPISTSKEGRKVDNLFLISHFPINVFSSTTSIFLGGQGDARATCQGGSFLMTKNIVLCFQINIKILMNQTLFSELIFYHKQAHKAR